MWKILPALLVCLWSAPALAQSWTKACQSGLTTGNANPQGSFYCYDLSGTNDSPVLNVHACENFDVLFEPDFGGAGATATVRIYNLATPTASTAAGWIIENLTLDGDPATNTEAIYGAAGVWIFVDVVLGPGGGEDARVIVHCND